MPWRVLALFSSVALWTVMGAGANGPQDRGALDRQFQSAVSHYNSGQYQDAARELESLVERLPASFDVQELLGLVYSAQAKHEAASSHFEKAVQLKPDSAAARANLAVNLSKLGENGPAEAEFKKAIALEPHSYEANHDCGEFYVRAGNLRAAIPYLEEAQRQNPSAYENGYDLALAYEQTNQMKSAERLIRQMLASKDTAELHNLLAEVDEKAGDYVTAANEYQRAAHMDPSESNLFDWGSELLLHHTLDPAIQVLSQGVQHYPDSSRLTVGLGIAFFLRGSYDDAVKALLRAIDLAPSDARAYYFLSKAYDMAPSQADDVILHFERFSELQPQNAKAHFYYAMSLWKGKQAQSSGAWVDQVESLLKKAASLDPSFPDVHLQLANLYSQERKYAEAVPEYQRALSLDPNVPDAHYRLGQAYVHLNQKGLAQKEFQLHKELYEKHLVEIDEQRTKIRQFIYSMKGAHAGS
jgi:tetratricopeptide (TPR) repeat protein